MGLFRKRAEQETELQEMHSGKNKTRGGIFRLKDKKPWVFWGILVSLLCAFVFSRFYGVFRTNAERYMESPVEGESNVSWLYQSCYLLYRDLQNAQHEEQLDYFDIYLDMKEGYQWLLDKNELQEYYNELDGIESAEGEERLQAALQAEGEKYTLDLGECDSLQMELEGLETYFENLDQSFQVLNSSYDYIVRDDKTGKYVTNMSVEDMNRALADQYFLLSFVFDSAGNVTVGDTICGRNESQLRKNANGAVREEGLQSRVAQNMTTYYRYGDVKTPADCTVTFSISREAWEKIEKNGQYGEVALYGSGSGTSIRFYGHYYGGGSVSSMAYLGAGVGGILLLSMLGIAMLAFFLPVLGSTKPWKEEKICGFSFEILFIAGCAFVSLGSLVTEMIAGVASGRAAKALPQYLPVNTTDAEFLVGVFNLLVLTLFFFFCWYFGICARAVRDLGLKEYIRQKSLIYRIFPYMKRKLQGIYHAVTHLDLTKNAHRSIIKIVLVNAAILFVISFLWFGGMALTVAYSAVLYLILRKYVSDLQKKYGILLKAVDGIAEGNLNVSINEDLGIFEPFRNQLFKIRDGLKKAVDTEFRSQKMKVELITNMSHDLKTPLTAIITYVNLLKEENITEEQRREYLATLERKSLRLKSLIEDLFEFSKANSNNVTLNIMDVDIMNLVKQVAFEMSDKIGESGLDIRMNLTEERVILPLDSQKTYRIFENLFGNIAKYALEGTRVYVNGFRIGDMVVITLKNISAQEITVEASDLTERFVRGDASRNTEGSGLGLAIAKSFTELQGGQLEVEVDGDLFKVTTTWHIAEQ